MKLNALVVPLLQTLLPLLVRWLTGLHAADFAKVKAWVEVAERQTPRDQPGEIKARWVRDLIRQTWPSLATWAVNLLNELAVAWLNKFAEPIHPPREQPTDAATADVADPS